MAFLLILVLLEHVKSYPLIVLHRDCDYRQLTQNSSNKSGISLFFLFILGLLFFLIFLGFLKGVIGLLWSHQLGMFGLDALIDLPQPLTRYYEDELRDESVVYDDGGWPIHPSTGERTVQIISKRTEFCLNLVFFLSYPLASIIFLCSLCCGITNADSNQSCACNIIKIDGLCTGGSSSSRLIPKESKELYSQTTTTVTSAFSE